ncbi:MAG: hypothetical protein M1817_001118 [Caeruleum heppii]|nr:MAG: hypothetical protein M1817_001118 [Caeruleum heppii]
MTTFVPLAPYTPEQLDRLYPKDLQLQLVQVLLRHGERSPVSARFQNAGLAAFWPYCASARRLSSVIKSEQSADWDRLQWRRRLETFDHDDNPVIARGPNGGSDDIWLDQLTINGDKLIDSISNLGELTDIGRDTTSRLGGRLRRLYVDQLGFMPKLIADADMIYLRATPIARALESVQQSFVGMYPPSARTADFPTPTIVTRTPADETLFPNDGNCRRFSQLSRAFAQRTADRWNHTKEVDYLNNLISKWMGPDNRVAVDSHPRLSGIMDTINSTLAHPAATRLPKEFYDPKGRQIIDRIGVEEWFSGYKESIEYRSLGIGALMGDLVSRMVGNVEGQGKDGLDEIGGTDDKPGLGRGGEDRIKFAMSGCHDTTLAAILASLGTYEGDVLKWPPYTSHIALELFREKDAALAAQSRAVPPAETFNPVLSVWDRFVTGVGLRKVPEKQSMTRKTVSELTLTESEKLDGYYVRLRYNDRPLVIPGCKAAGKHREGDESLCTLTAFKTVVDRFTPKNWKQACASNPNTSPFPPTAEPAGV